MNLPMMETTSFRDLSLQQMPHLKPVLLGRRPFKAWLHNLRPHEVRQKEVNK
jgi:hypothetical protein